MRTLVFKVPNRDLQALVTIYDDGRCTLAFRPGYGTWGPPIQSLTEQGRDASRGGLADLDSGPRPLPDHMQPDAHLDLDMEDRLGGGLADAEDF
jgi:hypothetical protein